MREHPCPLYTTTHFLLTEALSKIGAVPSRVGLFPGLRCERKKGRVGRKQEWTGQGGTKGSEGGGGEGVQSPRPIPSEARQTRIRRRILPARGPPTTARIR